MPAFATTPTPPYYAVIFSSKRTPSDGALPRPAAESQRTDADDGYAAMADEMDALARAQPGCLGAESARSPDGFGITVSYWRDEASIAAWKAEARHTFAQRLGKQRWYEHYELRVAKVERAYSGPEGRT